MVMVMLMVMVMFCGGDDGDGGDADTPGRTPGRMQPPGRVLPLSLHRRRVHRLPARSRCQ